RIELEGGNPYRARAYSRAAETLSLSPLPLEQLVMERRLTEIPGIGDALAAVVSQLHETGQHPRLEAMREAIPQGVLELLRVTSQFSRATNSPFASPGPSDLALPCFSLRGLRNTSRP